MDRHELKQTAGAPLRAVASSHLFERAAVLGEGPTYSRSTASRCDDTSGAIDALPNPALMRQGPPDGV